MCYRSFNLIQEGKLSHNLVKQIREGLLMSKTELARKAGVSALTIDRIEKGLNCWLETKKKIIVPWGVICLKKTRFSRRIDT